MMEFLKTCILSICSSFPCRDMITDRTPEDDPPIHLTPTLPSTSMGFRVPHHSIPELFAFPLSSAEGSEPWMRMAQCEQLRHVHPWSRWNRGTAFIMQSLKSCFAFLREALIDQDATTGRSTCAGSRIHGSLPSAWMGLLAAQSPMPAFILTISAGDHAQRSSRFRRCQQRS